MKTRVLFLWCWFVLIFARASEPAHPLITHEWGTFTCVQGADGVQVDWNPFLAPELPAFVYKKALNGTIGDGREFLGLKTAITCRQRMETPVLYFYGEPGQNLDVAVRFPEGTITEWYPQAMVSLQRPAFRKEPALHWTDLRLVASSDSDPVALPQDASGSHYFAARNTDSNLLRSTPEGKRAETEKFLFYRGVASFQTPLRVNLATEDGSEMVLINTGTEELRDVFVYAVDPAGTSGEPAKTAINRWIYVDRMAVGESRKVALGSASNQAAHPGLKENLQAALVRQGLYEKEAVAMIQTWESTWFEERGVRALYLLPRQWTDRNLPLQVTPQPAETARVMVARAEVITPRMVASLLDVIDRYIAADPSERAQIVAAARSLGLGRFMDPAMRLLITGSTRKGTFYSLSWELLQAATAKPVTVSQR